MLLKIKNINDKNENLNTFTSKDLGILSAKTR